ncbi:MAG: AAA family ATPase [Planctomycetota bacterium]
MSILDLRCMARIQSEPLQWAWKNRIPRKKTSLLVGDPEVGKSLLLLDLAARFSTGAAMPDGTEGIGTPGNVMLFCAEDDPSDTIRPRLQAAGADLERIWFANEVLGDKDSEREWFALGPHLGDLEAVLKGANRPWLVGFDPLQSFIGRIDANRDNEVRSVMGRLAKMGPEYDATFVCVMHLNKGVGLPAMYRTGGSIAFPGLARTSLLVAKDKEMEGRRLLIPIKNNLAPKTGGLSFRVTEARVESLPNSIPRIEWDEGVVERDADSVLSAGQPDAEGSAELTRVVNWLRERLVDGPAEATTVFEDAEAEEIAKRTLNRAKKVLRVRSRPRGKKPDRKWYWELPEEDAPEPDQSKGATPDDDAGDGNLGDLGNLDGDPSEEAGGEEEQGEKPFPEKGEDCQERQDGQGGQEASGGDLAGQESGVDEGGQGCQPCQDGQPDHVRRLATFPGDGDMSGRPEGEGEPSLTPDIPDYHDEEAGAGRRG